ncbi:hypothetical protein ACQP1K_10885 [Sphaerimonospora sp. CA-214678]|uniref:hypothetical protein n=1 Tax=Sphaerimonospora sp. CA-214678 TaxID=3240029 RepID=UPI003D92FA92
MIKTLHRMGMRSNMAYGAGFASIGATVASWFLSMQFERAGTARADRWGLFIGEWAPTFFALGVALRLEEMKEEKGREAPEFEEQRADIRQPARAGM